MALYQLHFLTPRVFCISSFSSKPTKSHLKCNTHQNSVHGCVIYASSSEKPRKKKGRPSRSAMSDEDLCKELREIMFVAGLPADRVPLMKELSEHGRKDLANIVRRRGYKAMRELLSTSNLSDNYRETSVEDQERSDPQEFEESHLCSAESISSLRISPVVEDYTAETNGTMKNDMPVQIGEPSRSSIGPMHLAAAYSYQNRELDIIISGAIRKVHPLKEDQLFESSDWVGNQATCTETNEKLASNMAVAEDNDQTEIDHLTALLRQKEMEFVELKQHIEKEKQALTMLQARAQNEIGNVHRVIWSKDAELRAAEDKLSGLKEVQVQYRVNGETVEVAGSFNGWHKQIKMDLHPSSSRVDLQGPRESKLWSTILWLYPGTYEIKFIVDGQWRIDPEREVATNGHITNNVLKVDR